MNAIPFKILCLILMIGSFELKGTEILDLVFTANRFGEIQPCDCQGEKKGGLARWYEWQKKRITKSSLLLDAGDTFFQQKDLPQTRWNEAKLKAETIADTYALFNGGYFSPGERDFAFGMPYLQKLLKRAHLVGLSANLFDSLPDSLVDISSFQKYQVIQKGTLKILITGVHPPISSIDENPKDVAQSLKGILAAEKPGFLILLSHLGTQENESLMAIEKEIPVLVIGSHSLKLTEKMIQKGNWTFVETGEGGQNIGRIGLDLDSGKMTEGKVLEDLGRQWDRKNVVSALLENHFEKLRKMQIDNDGTEIKKKETSTKPYIANPFYCKQCHQKQYDFWENTKHASAYLVLYSKNQHFDPECIECHTLGFEQTGGFKKITQPIELNFKRVRKAPFVEELMASVFGQTQKALDSRIEPQKYAQYKAKYHHELNLLDHNKKVGRNFLGVQCEHCHGNRNGHPTRNTRKSPVSFNTCLNCHKPPNAPEFHPDRLAKVACPRIGD